mmetsp:Transcript_36234/g.108591  ORF Transcript_36234/g.108591 Transcript_36234/m.108591 type:complete len:1105 (-) Transcript_36234:344-3658(-)
MPGMPMMCSPVGMGKPPTGKAPMSMSSSSCAIASAAAAAGVDVSPPPLPSKARLAGHRRMPCRARSVPVGHTPQTAYLSIPPDAPHGMVLMCSHPECAASGKRFRFCAVCDIPVAKRNFLKRHSHGLVSPGSPAAQVGQPGAITSKEAVAMAKSLGTVTPSGMTGGSAPGTPRSDSAAGTSGADASDEDEEGDEGADSGAVVRDQDKDGDAKTKDNKVKKTIEGASDGAIKMQVHGASPARVPSLSSMPMSPLSTGSVRPRSDSDDSQEARSAFGTPAKRARDGGSTPPKDRLRPPESIDLALPRMPGDDAAASSMPVRSSSVGPAGQGQGSSSRGRTMARQPSSSLRMESPRPLSPPRLQTCRTFPLPPPHREPRFATAEPTAPEEYYARSRYASSPMPYSPPQGQGQDPTQAPPPGSPSQDDTPPTPSRLMVAGVSHHSRPGVPLNFNDAARYRDRQQSLLSDNSPRASMDNEDVDVGLNTNEHNSNSPNSLRYRSRGGDAAPVHRFRARLRTRESQRSSGSVRSSSSRHGSLRSADGSKAPDSGAPGPQDFEPPTPEASVVRLSRKERRWLELLRNKPSMSLGDMDGEEDEDKVDQLEEWMDRVLDITDSADAGDGANNVTQDKSMEQENEPRVLNEVVRHAHPRDLNPPSDENDGGSDAEGGNPAEISNEGDDMAVDGDIGMGTGIDKDQRLPSQPHPSMTFSRDEPPLVHHQRRQHDGECLMDARARAKRNLHRRASQSHDDDNNDRQESRTDIDATDSHSIAGGSKGGSSSGRRSRGGRDVPTPPPMCGIRSGLTAMFGCGAFLCADDGGPGGPPRQGGNAFGRGRDGGGPCAPYAPCVDEATVNDHTAASRHASRAGTPVNYHAAALTAADRAAEAAMGLDVAAPIRLSDRVNSRADSVASTGSVSMTGSSMVDLLEGTGLMPIPGTPGGHMSNISRRSPTHTLRDSDGEFRYLDNILMDDPMPFPSPRKGSMVSKADEDMKEVSTSDDSVKTEESASDADYGGRGPISPPRGKHRLPNGKRALPSLPALLSEERVGDVSISMNKSGDEMEVVDGGGGGEQGEEVETELKVKEETNVERQGTGAEGITKEVAAAAAS